MKLTPNLRDLIGIVKDKASQSKAAIISNPKNLSLLRATTHHPFSPPHPKFITTFLSYGYSSRATASSAIHALMDRLHSTHNSSVAIKCLIIVHHIIKHGSFILQDQLSVYPSAGGRNYLKLSSFRDCKTPVTWELSSWVRWYARYLEQLISTSRVLGFFLSSTSNTAEEEKVSSLTNSDLIKEIDSLSNLMVEICKRPEISHMQQQQQGNELLNQIIGLSGEDYLSSTNEIATRVGEFNQRLSCLSFSDSVELVCVLKRLEDCKDRLLVSRKKDSVDGLWDLISEMKNQVGVYRGEGKLMITIGGGRDGGTESARFGDRVVSYGTSVRFSSARFGPIGIS